MERQVRGDEAGGERVDAAVGVHHVVLVQVLYKDRLGIDVKSVLQQRLALGGVQLCGELVLLHPRQLRLGGRQVDELGLGQPAAAAVRSRASFGVVRAEDAEQPRRPLGVLRPTLRGDHGPSRQGEGMEVRDGALARQQEGRRPVLHHLIGLRVHRFVLGHGRQRRGLDESQLPLRAGQGQPPFSGGGLPLHKIPVDQHSLDPLVIRNILPSPAGRDPDILDGLEQRRDARRNDVLRPALGPRGQLAERERRAQDTHKNSQPLHPQSNHLIRPPRSSPYLETERFECHSLPPYYTAGTPSVTPPPGGLPGWFFPPLPSHY